MNRRRPFLVALRWASHTRRNRRWVAKRLDDAFAAFESISDINAQSAVIEELQRDRRFTLPNGTVLHNVHPEERCKDRPCVIHNPTDHHMRDWRLHWRDDRGIFERLCPNHGTGHPDPDQFDYWKSVGEEWQGIHGCCGCCREPA